MRIRPFLSKRNPFLLSLIALSASGTLTHPALAQAGSSSGTLYGTVQDGAGAIVPGASVSLLNPRSG